MPSTYERKAFSKYDPRTGVSTPANILEWLKGVCEGESLEVEIDDDCGGYCVGDSIDLVRGHGALDEEGAHIKWADNTIRSNKRDRREAALLAGERPARIKALISFVDAVMQASGRSYQDVDDFLEAWLSVSGYVRKVDDQGTIQIGEGFETDGDMYRHQLSDD